MKRVIILTNAFNMGGTEAALNSLLNSLNPEEYRVTVCCIMKRGPLLERVPDWVEVEELEFKNPMYRIFVSGMKEENSSMRVVLYKVLKKLYYKVYKQTIRENRLYRNLLKKTEPMRETYDLLLDFHGYGYFLTAYGIREVQAKKKAMWIHDEDVSWIYKVGEYMACVDKIFCVSEAVKTSFEKEYPQWAEKTEVFYNLTDTERIRKAASKPLEDPHFEGENKLLTIGRMEDQKGYDIAIEAAKRLKQMGVLFCWFFIGSGTKEKLLKEMVKKEQLDDCVVFMGRKDNPFPYLKACDLYVQPSRHEGYATTVLEARVLKKAIVASNIPSNQEQITDGMNGYLVELDAQKIADKVSQILMDTMYIQKVEDWQKDEIIDFSEEIKKLELLM